MYVYNNQKAEEVNFVFIYFYKYIFFLAVELHKKRSFFHIITMQSS